MTLCPEAELHKKHLLGDCPGNYKKCVMVHKIYAELTITLGDMAPHLTSRHVNHADHTF